MQPYEIEPDIRYDISCISCGCHISIVVPENADLLSELEDILYVIECFNIDNYDEDVDAYTAYSSFYRFHWDSDHHGCGCTCYGEGDADSPEYQRWLENAQRVAEPVEGATQYACGECHTLYSRLSGARACCSEKEDMSPEQLMEALIAELSNTD